MLMVVVRSACSAWFWVSATLKGPCVGLVKLVRSALKVLAKPVPEAF